MIYNLEILFSLNLRILETQFCHAFCPPIWPCHVHSWYPLLSWSRVPGAQINRHLHSLIRATCLFDSVTLLPGQDKVCSCVWLAAPTHPRIRSEITSLTGGHLPNPTQGKRAGQEWSRGTTRANKGRIEKSQFRLEWPISECARLSLCPVSPVASRNWAGANELSHCCLPSLCLLSPYIHNCRMSPESLH